MSKIVLLEAQLSATENMDEILQKLRLKDPVLARMIEELNINEVIGECIQGAFEILKNQGIEISDYICDHGQHEFTSWDDQEIIGALKTSKLPNGLGVVMKNGAILFVADEYKDEWKEEISRLKKIFTDAYLLEAVKSVLVILGYNIEPIEVYETQEEGERGFNVTGIKAGA